MGMGQKVEGLVACVIAVLFFGSNYVPLRSVDTADGMFAQWMMGTGVLLVGIVVQALRNFPTFYPLAMLGGALWATGNAMTVYIVNQIGMAMGLLLWSTTNLLMGWASGRFGWFGIKAEVPATEERVIFNYLGVVFTAGSGLMFLFVKTSVAPRNSEDTPVKADEEDGNEEGISPISDSAEDSHNLIDAPPDGQSRIQRAFQAFQNNQNKILASIASLISGCFFGVTFDPVIYVQDNYSGASQNGLDYVFAQFCGIFVVATLVLIVYACYKRNQPLVPPEALLPSLIAGAMWAIAQCMYFIANDTLGEENSFPIVSRTPGLIGALWGIFYFKEIKGAKNLGVLGLAVFVLLIGKVFATLAVF